MGPRGSRRGRGISGALRRTIAGCAVAAAVLAASGCSGSQNSFFPLTKGRVWVYTIDLKTGQGKREMKHVVANLGSGVLHNHKVYVQRAADGLVTYFRVEPGGIFRVGDTGPDGKTHILPKPVLVLPRPAALSAPSWADWEYTAALQRGGPPKANLHIDIRVRVKMTYTVSSTDSVVEVPAGRFGHCLQIRGTGEVERDVGTPIGSITIHVVSTKWYAPGVGLVKVERKESTSSPIVPAGELKMQLQSRQG